MGYFSAHDSIIDPDLPEFEVKCNDKFEFLKEGLIYNYKIIELIEDRDWIFTNNQKKTTMQIESWSNILTTDENNDYMDVFLFYISKKMKIHTRIFKKIQNVLAEIGGIFSTLAAIGNLILKKFNQTSFEINIINKLFSNFDYNEDLKKEEKSLKEIKSNNFFTNLRFFNRNHNLKKIEKIELKLENDKKNQIIDKNIYLNNNSIKFINDISIRNENNSERKLLELNSKKLKKYRKSKNLYNINDFTSISYDNSNLNLYRIYFNNKKVIKDKAKYLSLEKIALFIKENKNYKKTENLLIRFSDYDIMKYIFCSKKIQR